MKKLALTILFTCSVFAQRAEFPIERPVSPVRIEELTNGQQPLIAGDGHSFLAVWTIKYEHDAHGRMFAARIDANGTVLDPNGIALGEGFASDLIWTGRSYLLAVGLSPGWFVYSLDAEANVLAKHLAGSSNSANAQNRLRLATNGTSALLAAWNGVFVRLTLDGKSVGSSRFSGTWTPQVDVASNGRDYLVAYSIGGDLFARSISATSRGAIVDLPTDRSISDVAVEAAGDSYLVVWSENGVFAQPVDANAVPIGERTTVQRIAATARATDLRTVRDGNEIVVTNAVGLSLFETRVDLTGEPVTAPRVFGLGSKPHAAIAGSTTAYVWRESRGALQSAVSHARGPIEDVQVLSRGIASQGAPKLARAGDDVAAVWAEQNELRIARAGGEPQTVARIGSELSLKFDVASDGRFLWVAWRELYAGPLFVRRYSMSLEPVDDVPVEIDAARNYVSDWQIVPGLDAALIVWRASDGGAQIPGPAIRLDILATPLVVNGGMLHVLDEVVVSDQQILGPTAAAWNGDQYVIAWTQAGSNGSEIVATRMTREGVLVDPVPLLVADPDAAVVDLAATRVAGNGIALTWIDGVTTRTAIFRGQALPAAQTVRVGRDGERFAGVFSLSDGLVVVYRSYGTNRTYVTYTASGVTRDVTMVDDVVAIGDELHFGFRRVLVGSGVLRAYVGTLVDTPPRRRVVR